MKTAVVKYAIDNFSARCLTPERSGERIREAARLALVERDGLHPYVVEPPYTMRVTLKEPAQAGAAANVPGVLRQGPTTVSFASDNYDEVYGELEAVGTIAGTVR